MRIVKDNTKKKVSRPTLCLNCKSELEVDIIDCRIDNSDPREEPAYVFVCPCCKNENWIAFSAWDKKKDVSFLF